MNGKLNKANSIAFCNIKKETVLKYIKECLKYLKNFEKCLYELKLCNFN